MEWDIVLRQAEGERNPSDASAAACFSRAKDVNVAALLEALTAEDIVETLP